MGLPGSEYYPDFSQVYDLIDSINNTYNTVSSLDVNEMNENVQSLTKLDEMKKTLDNFDTGIVSELTNEISTWTSQIGLLESIQQTITDINGNVDSITGTITIVNDTLNVDLIQTIMDIKTNIDKSISLLDEIPTKLTSLGSEISTASENIDDIGLVVSTLNSISVELIPQLENLKTSIENIKIDDIQSSLTDDLTKIKTVIGAVNSVKQKVTDLEELSEIDTIIKSLDTIPTTLNTLIARATELKSVIPETGELITTVNSMVENGNNLTGNLTTQIKTVLDQVKTIPTYLEYVNQIHEVINNFAPSIDELQIQVGRLTSYEDIKQLLEKPIEEVKKKVNEAEDSIKKIIDFIATLPVEIYKLITGILDIVIDVLFSIITDYLPTVIIILVFSMLFIYLYPTVIGLVI